MRYYIGSEARLRRAVRGRSYVRLDGWSMKKYNANG